ncbi:MAG: KH domain-containing protein [Proteobacteria bacterium]|nr:KH domain-containing protein [Pseudomonadota bacterium]
MTNNIDSDIWIEDFLTDLLERTGLDVSIEELSINENDVICIQLSGPDSALVIGREGQTLEAFQHILVSSAIHNRVANRRILLDVESYRERREQRIIDEANRLANEVLDTGVAQDVSPMSPRERRLVHMVVSDIDGLMTESVGEGDERYVRIIPEGRE